MTQGVVEESSTSRPPVSGGSGGTGTDSDAAGDFDPDRDNARPDGMAVASDRFSVADWDDGKVDAHSASGTSSTEGDHGDARASATNGTLGSPVAGRSDPGSDTDCFRLRLSASTAVATCTTGSLDTIGSLQDASGAPADSDDDGGEGANFRMEAPLSAGTRCVEAGSHDPDTGSYALHAERRETGADPDPPSGGDCTPLDDWTVSSGRVRLLLFSAGRCVRPGNAAINGATYAMHSSKRQRRANSACAWADMPGPRPLAGLARTRRPTPASTEAWQGSQSAARAAGPRRRMF